MRRLSEQGFLLGWESPEEAAFGFAKPRPGQRRRGAVRYDGDAHLITVAPTGSGKGRGVIIPNLLTYPGSVIVTDFKGELYQVTARRRREMGQQVIRLDPFHVVGGDSDGFNPLDIFALSNADTETDAQMLAELLSMENKGVKDPFWDLNAGALHAGIIAHIATGMKPEERHLNSLRKLLYAGGNDAVYNLAVLLDTCGKTMNRMAYEEIAAFLQNSERETRPSILSTAVSYIKAFASQRVAATLAKSSFSLHDLVEGKPLSVYLVIPPDKLQSHKALLKLWVGGLLKAITSRQRIPERRTLFVLDECAQMGKFPFLETAVTLCRGYGLQCWTFWQDLSQLQSRYSDGWKTLLNNCGVVQTFGIYNRDMATQWGDYLPYSSGDLLELRPDEQVLQVHGRGAFRCRRLDYLKDRTFAGLYDDNGFYTKPANGHARNGVAARNGKQRPGRVGV